MAEIDKKIEQLQARKTGIVNRDDIIFILGTLRDVRSAVDGFTQAVQDSTQQIMKSAPGRQIAEDAAADAAADDDDDDDDTPHYICFNCGNPHDKPVEFCDKCHAGLKWKK